jgi:hypothetical protein
LRISVLACGLLLAFVSGAATNLCAQTLYGPGGLFIHPTAYTPPAQSLTLSASYFTQDIAGDRATQWVPLGLSYGVTSRLEVGAMYVDRLASNGLDRGSAGVFLRDQIVRETAGRPAVALSGSYLGSDVKLASVAASAGYHFRSAGRTVLIGHAGIQWGWRGDGVPPGDSVSEFIGAEAPVRYGVSVLAEYGTRFSFDYKESSALGLMWHSRHGFFGGGRLC